MERDEDGSVEFLVQTVLTSQVTSSYSIQLFLDHHPSRRDRVTDGQWSGFPDALWGYGRRSRPSIRPRWGPLG